MSGSVFPEVIQVSDISNVSGCNDTEYAYTDFHHLEKNYRRSLNLVRSDRDIQKSWTKNTNEVYILTIAHVLDALSIREGQRIAKQEDRQVRAKESDARKVVREKAAAPCTAEKESVGREKERERIMCERLHRDKRSHWQILKDKVASREVIARMKSS